MAVIKTIFKGESLSMLFTFPEAYDMARIEKHEVYIGETAFTGTVSGKTIALKLKSDDTGAITGQHRISLWLDDSILGVKKPYLGDIVFSNTNATPHNTSTSNISDIIIPIVISETAVTVGDILYNILKGDKGDAFLYSDFTPEQVEALKVKGDKGDSFEYEDFTPEQITVLQQPATDIASTVSQAEGLRVTAESGRVTAEGLRVTAESNRSGAELLRSGAESDRSGAELLRAGAEDTREMNEYNREQAEALRVQAEIDRQTNTGTAIQNAETATGQANDAAILANTKAGLANDAATNANTKAGLADTAAANANTKAGLANTAATNADNARLAIQGDLAGKQATLVSGTNIKTVNGQSLVGSGNIEPNLLATYTHSGNLEIAPTSVDLATGTFTKSAHGLINGDRISPIINIGQYVYPYNVYPRGLTNTDTGHYVVNSTADTFQISLTSGGAAVTFTANALMDLTKWHFEKHVLVDYNNSNIKLTNSFKIVYSLRLLRCSNMYIGVGDADKWVGSETIPQTADINVGISIPNSLLYACHFGYAEQKYIASPNMSTIHMTAKHFMTGTVENKFSLKFRETIKVVNSSYMQNSAFWIYGIYPANGFSFKIYSL